MKSDRKKFQQIQRLFDDSIGIFGLSESVGGKNERNAGRPGGSAVEGCVPHIDGGCQMMPLGNQPDIVGLKKARVAGTEMVSNIRGEAGGF